MKARTKVPDPGTNDEVAALIATLHAAGERLELLTAGEVDTVADREGRTFLLREAQHKLRLHEAAKQAGILNALPASIALLDPRGVIVSVNETWRRSVRGDAVQGPGHAVGVDYLEACDTDTGGDGSRAHRTAAGIRAVLGGERTEFSIEYPTRDSPTQRRWFHMTASPLAGDRLSGAIVMHLDISEKRQTEASLRVSEALFRSILESSLDAVITADHEGKIVEFNAAAEATFQLPSELAVGKSMVDLIVPPRYRQAHRDGFARFLATGTGNILGKRVELSALRADGTEFPIELAITVVGGKAKPMFTGFIRDITARKEAEGKIKRLSRVYAVLSGINTLILRVRNSQELFEEACRIAVEDGQFRMAWIGVVDRATMKLVPTASAGAEPEFLADLKSRFSVRSEGLGESMSAQAVVERKAVVCNDITVDPRLVHTKRHLERGIHSLAILPLQGGDEVIGVLALYAEEVGFFDEEEMARLTQLAGDIAFAMGHIGKQERLDYLAYYDELTGLANRKLFLERVAQSVRGVTNGDKLALYLVDIERFKNINDSLGRSAGDALLKQVAEWLANIAGDATRVARVGTDQFAVMLPEVRQDGDMARLLDKTLRAFLEHPFHMNDSVFRVAAKIGVALYPDDGVDADTLFKNAEAALKRAKATGDRYLFYTQRMTASVAVKLTLENQLRAALDNEEFVLHYQPKVNLASGKLTGAEALIRWNDPRTGLVPPGQFIPVLEEIGLIHEVGRWALRQAIADYLRWRAKGLAPPRIAVNVSPLQLRDEGFVDEIAGVIGIDPLAPAGLELELTESLIMEDVMRSIASLQAIRALGVIIAIDDFGTGYSSLSYLSKLPVDTLKIDRSFVIDMTVGPGGKALVSTVIQLAHSLKLKAVAEGVETEEQARLLRGLECDEMQGYLFSRPVPAETFEERFLAPSAPDAA